MRVQTGWGLVRVRHLGHNTVQVSGTDGQTYAITNAAAKIRMNGGSFQFNIAPSGTAGDPITFTQAMTLDASGNLGIGTTSPAQRLHILGASAVSARARVENASGYLIDVYAGVSDGVGLATGNNMMFFEVNSAERMRIDTSGNVGIGTSSPLTNLHVRVNALSGYTSVANSGLLIERGNGRRQTPSPYQAQQSHTTVVTYLAGRRCSQSLTCSKAR
jgi:hypothetical protein